MRLIANKTASVALQEMPSTGETSAQAILAVIGTDMSRFPTAGYLASRAGLCSGNNESAGKRKSGRTTKGNCLLREILITCAHSAVLKKGYVFLRTVSKNQFSSWKKTCLCRCCSFHADSDISHTQGWCSFQGSWS